MAGSSAAGAYRQGIPDGPLGQGQSLATVAHLLVQREGPGRETSDRKQGQANLGRGPRTLVYAAIQTQSDRIATAPGISSAAVTAGVYSEVQRQVEAALDSRDERQSHAGVISHGSGTNR
jgi:hypothetical protein